jgi:RNA polymerase sigma-32 factor
VEARDLSLDNKIGEEETTYLDMIPDTSQNQEDAVAMVQEQGIVKSEVSRALKTLNEKERYVIENRTMSDFPLSLQEIGNKFGISRERVRQIEKEAVKKLRQIEKLRMLADTA